MPTRRGGAPWHSQDTGHSRDDWPQWEEQLALILRNFRRKTPKDQTVFVCLPAFHYKAREYLFKKTPKYPAQPNKVHMQSIQLIFIGEAYKEKTKHRERETSPNQPEPKMLESAHQGIKRHCNCIHMSKR